MDKRKYAIVLSALLHDIGKFMQRAEVPCRYAQDENMKQIVCRYDKKGNFFTHVHSLWTADFIDTYQNYLPELPLSFGDADDTIVNLAAKHHNPSTILQLLISEADRLSAGDRLPMDEENGRQRRDSFKRTRMYPILEEISLNDEKNDRVRKRIELNKLSLERSVLFPAAQEDLSPVEGALLVDRYDQLWREFIDEFKKIPNRDSAAFIETLMYLLEKFTWCIPSSTIDLPDISLFDHSKTSAAIGVCLYDYHDYHGTLFDNHVMDRRDSKYLLVCGDISGIQDFIYSISSKGAAKGLKGRSFFLQMLVDAAGKYILRTLDYPLTNVLYAGGGKFYLLVANHYQQKLNDISVKINRYLLEKYNGALFLALGWSPLCGYHFQKSNFPPKWKEASEEANKQKRMKFSDLNYRQVFDPFGAGGKEKTCSVCKNEGHLELRSEDDPENWLCPDCSSAESLGQWLATSDYLVEVFGEQRGSSYHRFDIPFLKTTFYLMEDLNDVKEIVAENVTVSKLNSTDFLTYMTDCDFCAYGFKFIGGTYLPRNENGDILTFNELAETSSGIKRLGVLRMDVDNLGRIFAEGLGNSASISRVTTLSQRLSQFFGGYLNTLCSKEQYMDSVSIIYSGGDDLFIVGAWNHTVDLAEEINTEFREFCNSPSFTLSGGLALTPKKYPIYRGAKYAGDAEKQAKDMMSKDGREKDAFTFLNTALSWHDFYIADEIKELLFKCITDGKMQDRGLTSVKLSKGILDRLRRIYLLYEKNRTFWLGRKDLTHELIREKLRYHKWVWRSVYSLDRAAAKDSAYREEFEILKTALLQNSFSGKQARTDIIEFLNIPTRWTEFLLRKGDR